MTRLLFLLLAFTVGIVLHAQKKNSPNIVYILADDLGYGDLSSYGQKKFTTPNIDQLAKRGMRFTQHYSGSAVCAPSRSALMTGQHTGHTPIRGNKEITGEGQIPIPANTVTVAEVLQKAGYRTGAFGKWGLGYPGSEGDPNMQGFDEFYGYNCQRMAHRYYPTYLRHNQQIDWMPGNDWTHTVTYAPDKIQEATIRFIKENKQNPFFLFVPFVLPHAEIIAPDDSIYKKFKGRFEEKPFTGPYASDYGPGIDSNKYATQPAPHAAYASMVTRLDEYVGQIVKQLEEEGIADNTLILFASDNGPAIEGGADPRFFNSNGGLKGFKRDLYEGGIRSPFIAVWPGKIKPGSESDHVSAFWDMLPTFSAIAGAKCPENIDGISLLPTLNGKGSQQAHEYLYWEINDRRAVRKGDWKAVVYDLGKNPKGNIELYNLTKDPKETKNVAAFYPEIVAELKKIMIKEHQDAPLFPDKIAAF